MSNHIAKTVCRSIRYILIAAIMPLTMLAASCSKEENEFPEEEGVARTTVLVYMAAQNSLGLDRSRQYRFQKLDSAEIMAGRSFIPSDSRLLLFIDDAENPRLYQVSSSSNQPRLVKRWSRDEDSASPEVLKEVLSLMKTACPAENYGLVMWSHADGWLPPMTRENASVRKFSLDGKHTFSFGIDSDKGIGAADQDEGSQMRITDMAEAIKESGVHAKYIFFDACLMQNVEVAYTLREVADYIVASPIMTPALGSNYISQIKKGLFSDDPSDIVQTYYDDVTDPSQQVGDLSYAGYGIVMSAVRTDKMESLANAVSAALRHSNIFSNGYPDMEGVMAYHPYVWNYFYRPHFYDARQSMLKLFKGEEGDAAVKALDEAVVKRVATSSFYFGPGYFDMQNVDLSTYGGISMFIPQEVYTSNASRCKYGDLNEAFKLQPWYEAAGWQNSAW